jgi:hypothetical protein
MFEVYTLPHHTGPFHKRCARVAWDRWKAKQQPASVAQSDRGGPSDEELYELGREACFGANDDPAGARRALYEAGCASRDIEVAELKRELSRVYDSLHWGGELNRRELSEKDARIASLTAELADLSAKASDLKAIVANQTARIDELTKARDSALERAGAMDTIVASLRGRIELLTEKLADAEKALATISDARQSDGQTIGELGTALRMCLAELDCHEWLGPRAAAVEAARKALKALDEPPTSH